MICSSDTLSAWCCAISLSYDVAQNVFAHVRYLGAESSCQVFEPQMQTSSESPARQEVDGNVNDAYDVRLLRQLQ
jgi:hypothetical protein